MSLFIFSELDPLKLPDTDMFTDGELLGLSTVYRTGNSVLSVSAQAVNLEAHVGFVDLRATYKWSKRYRNHPYK